MRQMPESVLAARQLESARKVRVPEELPLLLRPLRLQMLSKQRADLAQEQKAWSGAAQTFTRQ